MQACSTMNTCAQFAIIGCKYNHNTLALHVRPKIKLSASIPIYLNGTWLDGPRKKESLTNPV